MRCALPFLMDAIVYGKEDMCLNKLVKVNSIFPISDKQLIFRQFTKINQLL